jgi:hypothetical protein
VRSIKADKQDPDVIQGFCQLEICLRKTALTNPHNSQLPVGFLLAFYHFLIVVFSGWLLYTKEAFFSFFSD